MILPSLSHSEALAGSAVALGFVKAGHALSKTPVARQTIRALPPSLQILHRAGSLSRSWLTRPAPRLASAIAPVTRPLPLAARALTALRPGFLPLLIAGGLVAYAFKEEIVDVFVPIVGELLPLKEDLLGSDFRGQNLALTTDNPQLKGLKVLASAHDSDSDTAIDDAIARDDETETDLESTTRTITLTDTGEGGMKVIFIDDRGGQSERVFSRTAFEQNLLGRAHTSLDLPEARTPTEPMPTHTFNPRDDLAKLTDPEVLIDQARFYLFVGLEGWTHHFLDKAAEILDKRPDEVLQRRLERTRTDLEEGRGIPSTTPLPEPPAPKKPSFPPLF